MKRRKKPVSVLRKIASVCCQQQAEDVMKWFLTPVRTKKLAEIKPGDVPRGLDPEDIATDAPEEPMPGTITDPHKHYRHEAENLLPQATRKAIMSYAAKHPVPGKAAPPAPTLPVSEHKPMKECPNDDFARGLIVGLATVHRSMTLLGRPKSCTNYVRPIAWIYGLTLARAERLGTDPKYVRQLYLAGIR